MAGDEGRLGFWGSCSLTQGRAGEIALKTNYRRAAAALTAMLVLGCAGRCAAQAVPEIAGAEARPRENAAKEIAIDLGNGATMQFVLIPPGSFAMGDAKGSSDEQPVHKVTITRPFYLGKYQVAQKQWKAVMGSNPSTSQGPQNPVDSVTWDGCQAFLAKLNAKFRAAGAKFSLPTEAQWEYACRAGSTGIFYYGNAEDRLGDYAWFSDHAGGRTHPVGEKKPNPWGLYDMYGNVWQWCADWYDADYYRKSPASDPAGPSAGSERVMRGGSWYRGALNCRSADRYRGVPGCPDYGAGFRVVLLSAPAQAAEQKPSTVRLTGD
jgi:formylglycine-generating enzyme required for sulfatase activity